MRGVYVWYEDKNDWQVELEVELGAAGSVFTRSPEDCCANLVSAIRDLD